MRGHLTESSANNMFQFLIGSMKFEGQLSTVAAGS